MAYHKSPITRGYLGTISKVQEEVDEYKDAHAQGCKILQTCELADIYGALEFLAERHHLSMNDLKQMSDLTRKSFEDGTR